MTNEMSTPKILVCPGDHAREAAKDWGSFTSANCTYDFLAASSPDIEPDRVLFRCPIHGHIGLSDGSVHAYIAKEHPERLEQRDGKLYLKATIQPAQGTSAQETFRRRYGVEGPPAQVSPAQPSTNLPPGGPNP
jgi:hypothetical protein